MNHKEGTSESRRARILDGANELILRYGYDKTTVAEIAREAGVSKGAIYLHFASKQELFEALFVREVMRYSADWLERVEADPKGGTMGGLYKNFLLASQLNPLMKAMLGQSQRVFGTYLKTPGSLIKKMQGRSMRPEFLTAMQEAGAVRSDVEADVVAHVMDVIGYGLVSLSEIKDPESFPPFDNVIEVIAEMMDGVLTPEDGADSEAGKKVVRRLLGKGLQKMREMQEGEFDDDG